MMIWEAVFSVRIRSLVVVIKSKILVMIAAHHHTKTVYAFVTTNLLCNRARIEDSRLCCGDVLVLSADSSLLMFRCCCSEFDDDSLCSHDKSNELEIT